MSKEQQGFGLDGFQQFTSYSVLTSPTLVLLSPSTMRLTFSNVLLENLGMTDWEDVIMAYNKNSKEIAIKQCDAEECGSRGFKQANDVMSSKCVSVKGLFKFFGIESVRRYTPKKSEQNPNIIILTPMENESEEQ